MEVSRQTFGNIISSAHARLADCVVNGKLLRIEGGSVMVLQHRRFECSVCGHAWELPHGTGTPTACPSCQSAYFRRAADDRGPNGRGRGMGHGHCGGQQRGPRGSLLTRPVHTTRDITIRRGNSAAPLRSRRQGFRPFGLICRPLTLERGRLITPVAREFLVS